MHCHFNDEFVFVTRKGAASPTMQGIMRNDKSAAIVFGICVPYLEEAYTLRHYFGAGDLREYRIKSYHRDEHRPLTKWLIKPIVIQLSSYNERDEAC